MGTLGGMTGRIIGMHTFGASAPLKALQQKFGFEPSQVVTAAKEQLAIGEAARVLRVRQDSRSPWGITSGEEDQSHDYCHFPNS